MVSLRRGAARARPQELFAAARLPQRLAPLAEIAPILRGAVAPRGRPSRRRLAPPDPRFPHQRRRSSNFVNGAELARYRQAGVVTPDHTIRTKNWPLIVPAPEAGKLDDFAARRHARRSQAFVDSYHAYFARNNARCDGAKTSSIRCRASCWCPGSACSASAARKKDAAIAADLAETAVAAITDAEAIGRFESISEADMFDMEYWSLEQAKLGSAPGSRWPARSRSSPAAPARSAPRPRKAFAAAGAEVALLDLDETAAREAAKAIGGAALAARLRRDRRRLGARRLRPRRRDTSAASTSSSPMPARPGRAASATSTRRCCARASSSTSSATSASRRTRCASCARRAPAAACCSTSPSRRSIRARISAPTACPRRRRCFLVRQYALDYGADGIRANAVNADRIRSGLLTDEMIAARSKARGLSREGLHGRQPARPRGHAPTTWRRPSCAQALALKTTADVTTVDGGNIAAALR